MTDAIGEERLRREVERLKVAIRKHRDKRGDDRCVADDYELYAVLDEPIPDHACRLNEPAIMIEDCARYIASRHDPAKPYLSPQREIDRLERQRDDLAAGLCEIAREDPLGPGMRHVPYGIEARDLAIRTLENAGKGEEGAKP